MSENVAVIASVLKPVDDTRLYEKLGLSIRESKQYRVNIIGFAVKNPPEEPGMEFHSLFSGQRLGLKRLLVPWRFLIKLIQINRKHKRNLNLTNEHDIRLNYIRKPKLKPKLKLKPKPTLLIVCTPELLIPAVIFKIIFGARLWYDVQENYQRNVKYQDAYLWALKPLLRAGLWLTENSSRWFVDHYLLAERGYARELDFVEGRHTILENKFAGNAPAARPQRDDEIKMIFSGTCSRENGIVEAMSLVTSLHQCGCPVKLTIAGQIPDSYTRSFIKSLADQLDFIELVGDGSLVPHSTIMELASKANLGLVAHQPNPSNETCIPTKVYEYLGLRLPMVLQANPLWESIVVPYQAAVVVDYTNFDAETLWGQLQTTRFYTIAPGPEITWEAEAVKLLAHL